MSRTVIRGYHQREVVIKMSRLDKEILWPPTVDSRRQNVRMSSFLSLCNIPEQCLLDRHSVLVSGMSEWNRGP